MSVYDRIIATKEKLSEMESSRNTAIGVLLITIQNEWNTVDTWDTQIRPLIAANGVDEFNKLVADLRMLESLNPR